MTQKVQKNFGYLFDEFRPAPNRNRTETHIPSSLADTIVPTFDAYGTGRWTDVQSGTLGATNASNVTAFTVPDGVLRFVCWAEGIHDDAIATHRLRFTIRNADGTQNIAIGLTEEINDAGALALLRHFYIPPGFGLRLFSEDAVGVGNVLRCNFGFIDLVPGSYLVTP